MGKPYDHEYYFAGQGCSCGTMVCGSCHQQIFNHAHDWLAYKKDKNGDWGFVCHHRKCWPDQSGWEDAERSQMKYAEQVRLIDAALRKVCQDFGMTLDELLDHIGGAA